MAGRPGRPRIVAPLLLTEYVDPKTDESLYADEPLGSDYNYTSRVYTEFLITVNICYMGFLDVVVPYAFLHVNDDEYAGKIRTGEKGKVENS